MKALVKCKKGTDGIALMDMEKPIPAANEILIKVHAGGICGTDIHVMNDEYPTIPPVIMGHEYSGIVEAYGSEVNNFKQGDRVVSLTAAITCGVCEYCNAGLLMLCNSRKSIGSGTHGAFAEYLCVPAHLAFHIPEEISMDTAALMEPFACVTRAVIETSKIKAGDIVLVSGPGTIGQLAAQVALAAGATVIVSGTNVDEKRLALALELGVHHVINVQKENIYEKISQLTGGIGVDIAYECSGVEPSSDTCLKVIKKTGIYSQIGLFGKKILFNHDLALSNEIHIVNSFGSERTSWLIAFKLLTSKKVNIDRFISAKIPLSDWKKAFEMINKKEGYKILLVP